VRARHGVGDVERGELVREGRGERRDGQDEVVEHRAEGALLGRRRVDEGGLREGVLGQREADGVAFGVVAVEQAGRRAAVDLGGELPAQVHRVLDADVQADATRREVHVGGVAREQHAAPAVLGGDPGGVAEAGQPGRVVHAEVAARHADRGGAQVLQRERVVGALAVGVGARDAVPAAAEGHGDERAVVGLGGPHRLLGEHHLADVPERGRVRAGEVDPGGLADGAARAVRPDHVGRGEGAGVVQRQGDRRGVLRQARHGVAAADPDAEVQCPLLEHLLGADLRERQHERVGRVERAEVEQVLQHPEVPVRPGEPVGQEPLLRAAQGEHLDRARVHPHRLRVRAPLDRAFEHERRHARQREFRRDPEPYRTRADHDDLGRLI
jgi:hypothetical protein